MWTEELWVCVLQMFALFSIDQRPMCPPYEAALDNYRMTIINSTSFTLQNLLLPPPEKKKELGMNCEKNDSF